MLPDDRRYSREHEWIRRDGEEGVIGLTEFAVTELGDIVYVELPAVGQALTQFASFGVVESVKAVSDLYAPASGSVVGHPSSRVRRRGGVISSGIRKSPQSRARCPQRR